VAWSKRTMQAERWMNRDRGGVHDHVADLTERSIRALRAHHDRVAAVASELTDEQLGGPSGAARWTIAQVLSHLGSQSEIMLPPLLAAVDGSAVDAPDNQAVWDRWDASAPRAQADGFVEHGARYLALLEGLSAEQRESVRLDLGFLPEPVPLSVALGMRLDEVALHSWDVLVGLDPDAEVDAAAATTMLDHFADGVGFLLGFVAKPDQLDRPAVVAIGDHALVVDDTASVRAGTDGATATFTGPPGAALRLIGGRLGPEHTPSGVAVTGNVSLGDLRAVFPGF
jgi:uncharacterized protein (TIGR03083 family)